MVVNNPQAEIQVITTQRSLCKTLQESSDFIGATVVFQNNELAEMVAKEKSSNIAFLKEKLPVIGSKKCTTKDKPS